MFVVLKAPTPYSVAQVYGPFNDLGEARNYIACQGGSGKLMQILPLKGVDIG